MGGLGHEVVLVAGRREEEERAPRQAGGLGSVVLEHAGACWSTGTAKQEGKFMEDSRRPLHKALGLGPGPAEGFARCARARSALRTQGCSTTRCTALPAAHSSVSLSHGHEK